MENQTVLQSIKDGWIEFLWWLKPSITLCIIQMGLTVFVTYGICLVTWLRSPIRSTFSQVLVVLFCLVFGLNYPLGMLRAGEHKGNYALMVTVCLLFMVFLPAQLAFFITPKLKDQMTLAKVITGLMWILLLVQMFA